MTRMWIEGIEMPGDIRWVLDVDTWPGSAPPDVRFSLTLQGKDEIWQLVHRVCLLTRPADVCFLAWAGYGLFHGPAYVECCSSPMVMRGVAAGAWHEERFRWPYREWVKP